MGDRYNAAEWLVDRHVRAGGGDRVAFRCRGESLTYTGLLGEIWRAQHALVGLGVSVGDRVVMVVRDELAFPAWFLGAMRSGAVPVPLSTMLRSADLGAIAADAGAKALVVSGPDVAHVAVMAGAAPTIEHVVVIDDPSSDDMGDNMGDDMGDDMGDNMGDDTVEPLAGVEAHAWSGFTDWSEAPVAHTARDSNGFWLYSSGTTGLPKGVMHRHGNPEHTATTYARSVLDIGADDRTLSIAKLFFAYGLGNSLTFPLAVGATAILNPDPPTPTGVLELLQNEQPTLFFAAPGFVAALLDADAPSAAFASIRATLTAGEALPADLQRRFADRTERPVLDGIGTTEALHIFLSNRPGHERPGTSGTPVEGYDIELLDDEGEVVEEPDTPGYLHVRGASVASGYWQRPEATAEAFRHGWLRTGDVYTRSADGYYTFLGRNSDMIKAGGIWVSPAEVESALVEHPDVLEAAVVGDRDDDGLETVVAFVVARSGRTIDAAALEAHCRDRMAAFKRPRRIVAVDVLPKTATGKVQRYQLRHQLAQ
jgi:benzoate-CoA ligase family protein